MTLTIADIAKTSSNQCGYSQKRCAELIKTTLEIIKEKLSSGEDVLISGFGKFSVTGKSGCRRRKSAPYSHVAPGTGRAVTFKCSPKLREKLNGNK